MQTHGLKGADPQQENADLESALKARKLLAEVEERPQNRLRKRLETSAFCYNRVSGQLRHD